MKYSLDQYNKINAYVLTPAILIFLIIGSLLLRIPYAVKLPISGDEISTLIRASGSSDPAFEKKISSGVYASSSEVNRALIGSSTSTLKKILSAWFFISPHGSLPYYLVIWCIRHFTEASLPILRIVNYILLGLIIPCCYVMIRSLNFSRITALITASLIATSPALTAIGGEARQYPLLALMSIFCLFIFINIFLRRKSRFYWWSYPIALSTTIYSSLFGFQLLLQHLLIIVFNRFDFRKLTLQQTLTSCGILCFLLAPIFIALFVSQSNVVDRVSWIISSTEFQGSWAEYSHQLSYWNIPNWQSIISKFEAYTSALILILSTCWVLTNSKSRLSKIIPLGLLTFISISWFLDYFLKTKTIITARYQAIPIVYYQLTIGLIIGGLCESTKRSVVKFLGVLILISLIAIQIASHSDSLNKYAGGHIFTEIPVMLEALHTSRLRGEQVAVYLNSPKPVQRRQSLIALLLSIEDDTPISILDPLPKIMPAGTYIIDDYGNVPIPPNCADLGFFIRTIRCQSVADSTSRKS